MILNVLSVCIVICVAYLLLYWFIIDKKRLDLGYTYFYITLSGFLYLSANVLSIFSAYCRAWILLLYVGVGIGLVCKIKKNGKAFGLVEIRNVLVTEVNDRLILVVYISFVVLLFFSILRALLYPPINNDSLGYHLIRAFYYYKNHKVSNIPSVYVVMNYSGPANAILISHWYILTSANEHGVNLIQLPAMITVFFAVKLICLECGCSERASSLTGLLAASLPLVILQSATTQNDLLSASYVLLAVYFMIKSFENISLENLLCLGIAGGCVALSKISSVACLIPFLLVYLVSIIKKYQKKTFIICFISLIGVLAVTSSFWIRNLVDLNGDFLALKPSAYMNGENEYCFVDYIGKVIIYLGYCCCGYIKQINNRVLYATRYIYNYIGAREYGNWSYYFVTDLPNHDFFPYGIVLVVSLCCIILILLQYRRYNKKKVLYSLLALGSLILSLLVMPGENFVQSVTRYMMGAVILCIPCSTLVIEQGLSVLSSKRVNMLIVMGCFIIATVNGYVCNAYDTAAPLKNCMESSYNDKRDRLVPKSMSWSMISSQIKEIIDSDNITKIGIYESNITSMYSMVRELCDEKYIVKSVYGTYCEEYIDENFNPEVIIWVGDAEKKPLHLSFNNRIYEVYMVIDFKLLNNNQAVLYR